MTQAKAQAEKWAEPHIVNVKTVSSFFQKKKKNCKQLTGNVIYYSYDAFMVMLMTLYLQKYIPAMKETVKTHVEPHVQTLSTKAKEAYHASKSAVSPHIIKFQEHVDPYYQVKFCFL